MPKCAGPVMDQLSPETMFNMDVSGVQSPSCSIDDGSGLDDEHQDDVEGDGDSTDLANEQLSMQYHRAFFTATPPPIQCTTEVSTTLPPVPLEPEPVVSQEPLPSSSRSLPTREKLTRKRNASRVYENRETPKRTRKRAPPRTTTVRKNIGLQKPRKPKVKHEETLEQLNPELAEAIAILKEADEGESLIVYAPIDDDESFETSSPELYVQIVTETPEPDHDHSTVEALSPTVDLPTICMDGVSEPIQANDAGASQLSFGGDTSAVEPRRRAIKRSIEPEDSESSLTWTENTNEDGSGVEQKFVPLFAAGNDFVEDSLLSSNNDYTPAFLPNPVREINSTTMTVEGVEVPTEIRCHLCYSPMKICIRKTKYKNEIREYPAYRCSQKGCQTFRTLRKVLTTGVPMPPIGQKPPAYVSVGERPGLDEQFMVLPSNVCHQQLQEGGVHKGTLIYVPALIPAEQIAQIQLVAYRITNGLDIFTGCERPKGGTRLVEIVHDEEESTWTDLEAAADDSELVSQNELRAIALSRADKNKKTPKRRYSEKPNALIAPAICTSTSHSVQAIQDMVLTIEGKEEIKNVLLAGPQPVMCQRDSSKPRILRNRSKRVRMKDNATNKGDVSSTPLSRSHRACNAIGDSVTTINAATVSLFDDGFLLQTPPAKSTFAAAVESDETVGFYPAPPSTVASRAEVIVAPHRSAMRPSSSRQVDPLLCGRNKSDGNNNR